MMYEDMVEESIAGVVHFTELCSKPKCSWMIYRCGNIQATTFGVMSSGGCLLARHLQSTLSGLCLHAR